MTGESEATRACPGALGAQVPLTKLNISSALHEFLGVGAEHLSHLRCVEGVAKSAEFMPLVRCRFEPHKKASGIRAHQ